jgi:hypothetical protein
MHRFVLVSFMFPGVPKIRDLEPAFNIAGDDWIRISGTTWLLWTAKPATEIYQIMSVYVDSQDNILITRIDQVDSFGRLPPWIWDWLNSKIPALYKTGSDASNALANLISPPKKP